MKFWVTLLFYKHFPIPDRERETCKFKFSSLFLLQIMSQHLPLWLSSSLAQTWIKSRVPLPVSAQWKTILVYSSCKAIAHTSTKHPSLTHQHKNRDKGLCIKQVRLGVGMRWGAAFTIKEKRNKVLFLSTTDLTALLIFTSQGISVSGKIVIFVSSFPRCHFWFRVSSQACGGGGGGWREEKNYSEDPRRHM